MVVVGVTEIVQVVCVIVLEIKYLWVCYLYVRHVLVIKMLQLVLIC